MNQIERELTISRMIEDELDEPSWQQFVTNAQTEPTMWRDAVEAFRDQSALSRLMDAAEVTANTVDAPVSMIDEHVHHPRPRFAASWAGWAVAAMVFLAWSFQGIAPGISGSGSGNSNNAGVGLANWKPTPDQAWNAYLEQGQEEQRVIGEMPSLIVVQTRQDEATGGIEIVYLRQVMERTIVPELLEFGALDEHGRPTLTRLRPTRRDNM